jgi:hypothetical protein
MTPILTNILLVLGIITLVRIVGNVGAGVLKSISVMAPVLVPIILFFLLFS